MLMEGEQSRYRSGHFNGGKNSHVTEVVSLERENGHIALVVSFMEGE